MTPPNLFNFATSELTQDAFLAYLLAWAEPGMGVVDEDMHRAGTEFLRLLLDLHDIKLTTAENLDVRVQVRNIDVLVYTELENGEKIVLVIEDKIHAGSYNDLDKYRTAAGEEYPDQVKILGIYLRTGNQADYSTIEEKGFRVVNRRMLLDFLNQSKTGDPRDTIYRNYRAYLQNYQDRLNAYQERPLQEWDGDAWVGFFDQVLLPEPGYLFGDYGYVANYSGGFQGCWWSSDQCPTFRGYTVYLQIEGSNTASGQSRLAIKMETVGAEEAEKIGIDRYQLIRALADKIEQQPKDELLKIARPKRLSAGQWMTAAEVILTGKDAPEDVADFLIQLEMMREFLLELGE